MLFNSFEFLIFLPLVFILFWLVFKKHLKHQNLLLVASSYVFYGWWDYRFLSLIILSTVVDYFAGSLIHASGHRPQKKMFLVASILFNLGVLGFFKYYNFFVDSWIELFSSIGYEIESVWTLNIILPVGISFYTFQTMSYSIDIYRGKLKPTRDFIAFAAFVSFFPQLVAGPIERATNLLPQILNKRSFNYQRGVQGLKLILWGMFKKVVIADSLAPMVNDIFNGYENVSGGTLWLGLIYFSFQIYCDFSGYSDIAIGTAKLFGIELMSNFKFPYFSRNIGEFWRRWHISLSTWFRDYLYIPLGGSKMSKWLSLRNIFIIFIVSGFWHGANWTFIIWGAIHATLYIPYFLLGTNRKYLSSVVAEDRYLPSIKEIFQMGITFFGVMLSWAFFRSENIAAAIKYLDRMFSDFSIYTDYKTGVVYVVMLVFIDWLIRADERNFTIGTSKVINLAIYTALSIFIISYFFAPKQSFIYFQF